MKETICDLQFHCIIESSWNGLNGHSISWDPTKNYDGGLFCWSGARWRHFIIASSSTLHCIFLLLSNNHRQHRSIWDYMTASKSSHGRSKHFDLNEFHVVMKSKECGCCIDLWALVSYLFLEPCWTAKSDWFVASKLLELFLRPVLWKQIENNFFLLVLTVLPVRHQLGKHCT